MDKDNVGSSCFVRFRVIFVDRVLRIRSHTIHAHHAKLPKEHEIRVLVQSRAGKL
jgi:hypothetical protein